MEDLHNIDLKGKRVLVRVDFNVPLNEMRKIVSAKRIEEAIPTIQLLQQKGAKIVLCSHLGKPKGVVNPELSLKPIYDYLVQRLSCKVYFSESCIGDDAVKMSNELNEGDILLLENLRFNAGEEKNDAGFAKELSRLGDFFVNDAFGTSHRKHASNYGLEQIMPYTYGLLMQKEMQMLNLNDKEHPIVAILGGAKVGDKIELISNLLSKVEKILIGGAMAFTFIKALNGSVAESKVEDDKTDVALDILAKAKEKGVEIILPQDIIVTKDIKLKKKKCVDAFLIPSGYMGVDIGSKTISLFKNVIKQAKTIVWNGPLGVIENPAYAKGTTKIAKAVAKSKAFSIIGGGDTVSVIEQLKLTHKVSYVSTGGGATLYFLQNN